MQHRRVYDAGHGGRSTVVASCSEVEVGMDSVGTSRQGACSRGLVGTACVTGRPIEPCRVYPNCRRPLSYPDSKALGGARGWSRRSSGHLPTEETDPRMAVGNDCYRRAGH